MRLLCLYFCCAFFLVSCASVISTKKTPIEVAILMPMEGQHALQGQRLNRLIQIGLEDLKTDRISISSYDESSSASIAEAKNAIIKKNTKIILGPLFSSNIPSIEDLPRKYGMIILTLSNNPLVARENEIFVFGHTPLKQIDLLINHLSRSHRDFVILAPKTNSTENLLKAITEMIDKNGAKVLANQTYEAHKEDIIASITKISEVVDSSLEDEDNNSKPVIIIMEENPEKIRMIFDEIINQNLSTKATLAGDSRIDVEYDQPISLILSTSKRKASLELIQQASDGYSAAASLNQLENLAYDLGTLVADAIGTDDTNFSGKDFRENFLAKIYTSSWYAGLSSDFRFEDAVAQRRYSIILREDNEYKVLEIAN
ncbi:MAG: penicillin-binding protein activator [Rickettsiaceae bacterium]|nr:penicillin-binding protein activator [Rickettsiaceae bacterium]